MPDDPVLISHRPERRRRSTVLLASACSCCCCCCVHSVGGVAGAIFGQLRGRKKAAEAAEEERLELQAADRYATSVYWLANLIIALVAVFVAVTESRGESPGNTLGIVFFTIALGLPLGQLGASVLALIYVNVFPPLRKGACLRRLGRITLHAFLGGLIGFAIMVPFAFMLK